ncbi:MAG: class I SAM-dependent methyltransferase [Eubacteriaceae bacterium]
MGFYEEISNYYDYIFPVGKEQMNFIENNIGNQPKKVLDIACGTGGYSIELAKKGYDVTAVDLDFQMIQKIINKADSLELKINVLQGNMLELKEIANDNYDLAFCIGNSLVHLNNKEEIELFLRGIKTLLKKDSKLIIQIINYDRIISQHIKSLPQIVNTEVGLIFKRLYNYDEYKNKIYFKTILNINGKSIENEIILLPLLSKDLEEILKLCGFEILEFFGDFRGSKFEREKSLMLVIVAS